MKKSTIIIIIVVLGIVGIIFLGIVAFFVGISLTNSKNTSNVINDKSLIYGKWESKQGTLFEFAKDGYYSYYKDKNDTSDNYYKGNLSALNDVEGMKELGITDDEFNQSIKKITSTKSKVFSLKMYMETLHSEGIDKSESLKKDQYYFFMFAIYGNDKDKAVATNVQEGEPIDVARVK